MEISGKVWGKTSKIFGFNNVEVHRVEAVCGGISSTHVHQHKHSMFLVESGIIKIKVKKNDYDLTDTTILKKGESTIIPLGEWHSFEIISKKATFFEIYWVALDPNDILRENVGRLSRPKS